MKEPDNQDDAALFRQAVGPVTPIRTGTVSPPRKPMPKPRARMAECDDADALSEFQRLLDDPAVTLEAGDTLRYRRDDVPLRIWQRLRRGHYSAQDELDLHGATAVQAEAMLRRFLNEARTSGLGCVRIIHGKGLGGSDVAPVLKNLVDRLLRQRNDIFAFHSAPSAQGGTGAVLVLLTRDRSKR
ncbi:MAG: Smr/MutS family protein [Xanthomonadaceae bacterium]|nr:Smr/MutS family protein [Xanthomonadaceae bacterium]